MTCGLEPGLSRIDELSSAVVHEWTARVPCWTPDTMTCSEPEPEPDTGEPESIAPAAVDDDGCVGGGGSPNATSVWLMFAVGLWALRRRETAGLQ